MGKRWHRDDFARAVWLSTDLTMTEKIIALCFADFAGRRTSLKLAHSVIAERCGIARTTVLRNLPALERKGWLMAPPLAARGTRQVVQYTLTIPDARRTVRLVEPDDMTHDASSPRRTEDATRRKVRLRMTHGASQDSYLEEGHAREDDEQDLEPESADDGLTDEEWISRDCGELSDAERSEVARRLERGESRGRILGEITFARTMRAMRERRVD